MAHLPRLNFKPPGRRAIEPDPRLPSIPAPSRPPTLAEVLAAARARRTRLQRETPEQDQEQTG